MVLFLYMVSYYQWWLWGWGATGGSAPVKLLQNCHYVLCLVHWLMFVNLIIKLMYMIPDNIVILINGVLLWLQVFIIVMSRQCDE